MNRLYFRIVVGRFKNYSNSIGINLNLMSHKTSGVFLPFVLVALRDRLTDRLTVNRSCQSFVYVKFSAEN